METGQSSKLRRTMRELGIMLLIAWPFLIAYLLISGHLFLLDLAQRSEGHTLLLLLTILLLPYLVAAACLLAVRVTAPRRRSWRVVGGVLVWLLYTYLAQAAVKADANNAGYYRCMRNIDALGHAVLEYADGHGGRLPDAGQWLDQIQAGPFAYELRGKLRCPSNPSPGVTTYAMNRNLSGKFVGQIKDRQSTVLLYETNRAGRDPNGTGADFPRPGFHRTPYRFGAQNSCFVFTVEGLSRTMVQEHPEHHW